MVRLMGMPNLDERDTCRFFKAPGSERKRVGVHGGVCPGFGVL